ncbi:MAG: nitrogen regulation protein NR(I) [Rhodanobacter sp.]
MKDEIWIVDDDQTVRFVLAEALRDAELIVREFGEIASVQAALVSARPGLILTDVRLPGEDGLALLRELQAQAIGPVIVMSAYTDVATAAAAYRAGAVDYLAKPFDLDDAVAAVRRALLSAARPEKVVAETPVSAPALLGQSAPMREVFRLIGRVAASDLSVLITGETGTGKELVARALHEESARSTRPFVALNTAAIPSELLESEMFGHEAGAFTGATRRYAGRFEQAEGGTLFLDEIGDMPLALQTRLLRVLAGGEFYRVGGRELLRSNVRIVAATHQDLAQRVADGQFRADLVHRLDVVRIALPALRSRSADIPLLARHFLATAAQELKLPQKRFSRTALKLITQRDFPGNVRELENLCRRLTVVAPGVEILPADLGEAASVASAAAWTDGLRDWALAALADGEADIHARARHALDQTLMQAALQVSGGHRQNAAAALGVGRNTLTRKLGPSRTRSR